MGRLILLIIPIFLLSACSSPSAPLAVADEHPHFANCAAYIQASMQGDGADAARATALENCLERNSGARQVATRL